MNHHAQSEIERLTTKLYTLHSALVTSEARAMAMEGALYNVESYLINEKPNFNRLRMPIYDVIMNQLHKAISSPRAALPVNDIKDLAERILRYGDDENIRPEIFAPPNVCALASAYLRLVKEQNGKAQS